MSLSLSVVIPAFNAAEHIERPINALKSQTTLPEVVVVDDGSTDGTSDAVRRLVDASPIAETLKLITIENGGVSNARNVGLAEATGDYVLFLDADDWVDPSLCASVLSAASAHDLPDLVAWRWYRSAPSTLPLTEVASPVPLDVMTGRELLEAVLGGGRRMWTGAVAYKRSFLKTGGLRYTPGCSAGEDREFIYKAAASADRALYLDVELSQYTLQGESLSQGIRPNHFDSIAAHRRARDFIRQLGTEFEPLADAVYEGKGFANFFRYLARWLLDAPEESVRMRLRALDEVHPGLTAEMRRVARKQCSARKFKVGTCLFAISPWLWALKTKANPKSG